MIWAPRGISSTYSARVGRSARYRAPRVVDGDRALGVADQGVVGDEAAVGVERLAEAERQQVALAAAEVDEEDHLPGAEERLVAHGAAQAKASSPVRSRPMISVWMSCVPS